jgi:hypothetical protein
MALQESNIVSEPPFSRKILRRIHKAMHQVESFTSSQERLDDFVRNGYFEGINANICDALLSIYETNEGVTLESTIRWAEDIPIPDDTPEKITLLSGDHNIIRAIANAYRQIQDKEYMQITGRVRKLSTSDDSQKTVIDGTITIVYEDEGKRHSIKVQLEEDDYKLACDAHKNGNEVTVEGWVDKSSKFWELVSPQKFTVIY